MQRKHFSGRFEWRVFARVFEFRLPFLQYSFKQKPLWLMLVEKRLKHVWVWLNWSFRVCKHSCKAFTHYYFHLSETTSVSSKVPRIFLFFRVYAKQCTRNLLFHHSFLYFLLCLNRLAKLWVKWTMFRISEVNSIGEIYMFLLHKFKKQQQQKHINFG